MTLEPFSLASDALRHVDVRLVLRMLYLSILPSLFLPLFHSFPRFISYILSLSLILFLSLEFSRVLSLILSLPLSFPLSRKHEALRDTSRGPFFLSGLDYLMGKVGLYMSYVKRLFAQFSTIPGTH
jgi:hypothetical protein